MEARVLIHAAGAATAALAAIVETGTIAATGAMAVATGAVAAMTA